MAAGAVDHAGKCLSSKQRLELVGSAADEGLLAELGEIGNGLPFQLLEDLTPWGVAAGTQGLVDGLRRELEQSVVAEVPIPVAAS